MTGEVRVADCREVLAGMEPGNVDFALPDGKYAAPLADPPWRFCN